MSKMLRRFPFPGGIAATPPHGGGEGGVREYAGRPLSSEQTARPRRMLLLSLCRQKPGSGIPKADRRARGNHAGLHRRRQCGYCQSPVAYLEHAGYPSQAFRTGSAFLSVAANLTPGCVLLDLQLPDVDGMEVQRRLFESETAHVVVLLTGTGGVPQAVTAMRAGAVDFTAEAVQSPATPRGAPPRGAGAGP